MTTGSDIVAQSLILAGLGTFAYLSTRKIENVDKTAVDAKTYWEDGIYTTTARTNAFLGNDRALTGDAFEKDHFEPTEILKKIHIKNMEMNLNSNPFRTEKLERMETIYQPTNASSTFKVPQIELFAGTDPAEQILPFQGPVTMKGERGFRGPRGAAIITTQPKGPTKYKRWKKSYQNEYLFVPAN